MAKKNIVKDETVEVDKTVKVKFINTYIGKLGTFYKNHTYEISKEIYSLLKSDCEEICL